MFALQNDAPSFKCIFLNARHHLNVLYKFSCTKELVALYPSDGMQQMFHHFWLLVHKHLNLLQKCFTCKKFLHDAEYWKCVPLSTSQLDKRSTSFPLSNCALDCISDLFELSPKMPCNFFSDPLCIYQIFFLNMWYFSQDLSSLLNYTISFIYFHFANYTIFISC